MRIVRNSSHYKPPASWKPVHLDELPVPQGSWKAAYEAKQKSYNVHLAAGVAIFVFTVGFVSVNPKCHKTLSYLFYNVQLNLITNKGLKKFHSFVPTRRLLQAMSSSLTSANLHYLKPIERKHCHPNPEFVNFSNKSPTVK